MEHGPALERHGPNRKVTPPESNERLGQPWGRIKILKRSCANGRKNASGQFDFLDYRDRRYMEERRAAELTRLAAAKGFSDDLTRTVEPFGNSVLQYVTHLFHIASVNARSPAPDTWK
jgi:hypothetical protein